MRKELEHITSELTFIQILFRNCFYTVLSNNHNLEFRDNQKLNALYTNRDFMLSLLSHLSGYHMTARWKAVNTRPEEGKEVLRLWHVETDEKDKKKVTRFLESMYNTNQ
jgi:hypothetical protein